MSTLYNEVMIYLAVFVFIYWLVRGTDMILGSALGIPRLTDPDPDRQTADPHPKISIIFAARNEERHVRESVEMMLAQTYPSFEIIAVNDRSEDGTGAILNSFTDPRLKVAHIKELPAQWLGKTHALYEGYRHSSGDWILFTDADVKMAPTTLAAAAGAVRERRLDHLCLFPALPLKNYLEVLFVSYFSLTFSMRFRTWAARSRRSKAYVGIGAFNFVRRSAYEKSGTHQALALDVADDMMLGKLIKGAGFHQMVMHGDKHISVRWVEGARGVMNSLQKNGFRGLDYNILYLVIATVGMLVVDILPFTGPFFLHGLEQSLCVGALTVIGSIYLAMSLYTPSSILAFPAHALGCLLFAFILWRSALSALAKNGVGWRGTHYPLEELRKASRSL